MGLLRLPLSHHGASGRFQGGPGQTLCPSACLSPAQWFRWGQLDTQPVHDPQGGCDDLTPAHLLGVSVLTWQLRGAAVSHSSEDKAREKPSQQQGAEAGVSSGSGACPAGGAGVPLPARGRNCTCTCRSGALPWVKVTVPRNVWPGQLGLPSLVHFLPNSCCP